MAHTYHLTPKSANAKTGPIPVSTTSSDSCPESCPLRGNGCYPEGGKLAIHWRKVTDGERGSDLDTFAAAIASLPESTVWRHNQAGDLPKSAAGQIDGKSLRKLVKANRGKRGFTYTHHQPTGKNAALIAEANREGFTVNLSANTLAEADAYKALGIGPVVVLLPVGQETNVKTPEGRTVTVCPNITHGVQCKDCKLCAVSAPERSIVGFPAHGAAKRKAELVHIGGAL